MRALIERGAGWAAAARDRLQLPDGGGRWRWLRWAALGAALFLLLWYPAGMAVYTHIDDDTGFEPRPTAYDAGGSKAVATAAALVEREIERWAPNKPFWHPAAALDNMPNYQLGLMYAISRFAIEMGDQLGRTRGSSAIDADLDRAAGLLKYDGRIWYWGSGGLLPMAPAQRQYLSAAKALARYNDRLANGEATYDRRADNLIALLDRVGADLGASSAALDKRALETNAGWFDTIADDLLFNVKGRLYAYFLLLRDIDGLTGLWKNGSTWPWVVPVRAEAVIRGLLWRLRRRRLRVLSWRTRSFGIGLRVLQSGRGSWSAVPV